MTVTFRVDASEVAQFATHLRTGASHAVEALEPVVEKGALNVKRGARRLLRGSISGTYLPHYPRSIDFDVESGGDWVEAEIGPNTGMPQGGMGPGVEFGSVHTRPIPHLFPALDEEEPRFMRQAQRAINRLLQ